MSISESKKAKLAAMALEARDASYCPYSGFSVGAALLTSDGRVYTGANIENASYTPTVCAERVAFFKAISAGERDFAAIAIAGGKHGEGANSYTPPCGVCRQVMAEFCSESFEVIFASDSGYITKTLASILPFGFNKENLV